MVITCNAECFCAGGSGEWEKKMVHFLPTQFCELSVLVKENTERKKIETLAGELWRLLKLRQSSAIQIKVKICSFKAATKIIPEGGSKFYTNFCSAVLFVIFIKNFKKVICWLKTFK